MVQPPNLEVLGSEAPPLPDVARTPRSRQLLKVLADTLHVSPDVAEQLALTHALAAVQAHQPLQVQVLWDPAGDPKPDTQSGWIG